MLDRTKLSAFIDYVHKINGRAATSRIHGLGHWKRVEAFGLLMAEMCPEADREVISWFAYTHDCMRSDDGSCYEHGPDAAAFVDKVRNTYMSDLSDDQIGVLKMACYHHTMEKNTGNVTADICFDADRLDLPRCGVTPDPLCMASGAGAELAGILSAEMGEDLYPEDIQPYSYDILHNYVYNKYKMTIEEAVAARHSVRQYKETPLTQSQVAALRTLMDACNREQGLHIQLILDDPKAFSGLLAKYCKFSGVNNYIALVGKKCDNLKEKLGHEGERLVLEAQRMGLNTCWVAGSYSKTGAVQVGKDEKYLAAISIGYGENQGEPHVSKPVEEVTALAYTPDWYKKGIECVMLAPSAMNKQNFHFSHMADGKVMAVEGRGTYAGLDLGIAKLHFEIGSGKDSSIWE